MKKYWQLLKISLIENLAYRVRILLWFIIDISYVVIFPFVWLVIYGAQSSINGFHRADIVTYYIIIAVVNTMAASHIADDLKEEIMKGGLNTTLVRPVNYFLYKTTKELSYRVMYFMLISPLIVTLSLLFHKYLIFPQTLLGWLFFLISLITSFALSHALQFLVGFMAFWLGETSALEQVRITMEKVFSGEIAPLVFFPFLVQSVALFLPFKYLSYFPAQIYLNQIGTKEILINFAILSSWLLGLYTVIFLIWQKGLRQYDGSGI